MAAVNITAGQYAQSQSARTDLNDMLLNGTTGGGTVPSPFTGLTALPAPVLDQFQLLHLALQRLMSANQLANNATASYPFTSASFATRGGTLLLLPAVTLYPTVAGNHFGVNVQIDGGTVGVLEQYGNEAEHMSMSRPLLVTGIAAGNHTAGLTLRANSSYDGGDRISLVIIELPF